MTSGSSIQVSSINRLSVSSSLVEAPPVPLVFTNKWGEGRVFDWYKDLQERSERVLINRVQVRAFSGGISHRCVMVYLVDGSACRFDRRPDETDSWTLILDSIHRTSRKAVDSYLPLHEGDREHSRIQGSSVCEIDMGMPPNTDLIHILSACFALSQDTEASNFDLFRYNCYFFSWTLAMVVVRNAIPFHLPPPEVVAQSLNPALGDMSQLIIDDIVKALLGIVPDVIAAARQEATNRIKTRLYPPKRLVRKPLMGFMCLSYREILELQLYSGLEDTIEKTTRERVLSLCTILLSDALSQGGKVKRMESCLLISSRKDQIRAWFRHHLATILWDTVLDIIATVHGNVDGQKALADIENNPVHEFHCEGKIFGEQQWTQPWNEALDAALLAARDAGRSHARPSQPVSTEFHNEIFDTVFTAANNAALAAARNAVNRNQSALNNPDGPELWEIVWEAWDKLWKAAHERTRVVVAPKFAQIGEAIATLLTDRVLASVRETQGQEVGAWVKYRKEERSPLSTIKFQERINQFVKSAYPTAGRSAKEIQVTMGRVWDTAFDVLQSGTLDKN